MRLTAGAAETIAEQHEKAATLIDGSASSAPGAVAGGIATGHLLDILAGVADTAGELAALNGGIGAQVRDAADDLGLTEEQVGAAFRRMQERVP